MHGERAALLAKADDGHLGRPALDLAAKVGVRLDPRDQERVVGSAGIQPLVEWDTVGKAAYLAHLHRGVDGCTNRGLCHPQLGQHVELALGRSAAMAAHGRDDERLQARLDKACDNGPHNHRQVGDTAAAGAHRDRVSLPHARQQAAGFERGARGLCHVVHAGSIKALLDFEERCGQG